MQPLPLFKIRCSAIGKIMGGINRPTKKQLARLALLEKKDDLTDKQKAELAALKARRDAKPTIVAGAKTYCEQWVKEQAGFYNRTAEFTSKYTERGTISEHEAIQMIVRMQGYSALCEKNEEHFEDAEITGTPDLITANCVDDAKCSWSWQTFPLFATALPESDYFYQMQGYMALTGKSHAAVNYCLIDTPYELVEREAKNAMYRAGLEEMEQEVFDRIEAALTYGDVPDRFRYKRFRIERDDDVIEQIRSQVHLCRAYIATLWERFYPQPSTLIATQADGCVMVDKA